ncbi:[protein-PII] uridylyltransferase [Rugosimonospora acidiphila]|uniref:Bifunctional uridylyltransferase/uridylyl-removing enzyme n=1 Tax=Rugosimonospora acidiphila TaxID=556531 RepID=A0ABP9RN48_9ACTN
MVSTRSEPARVIDRTTVGAAAREARAAALDSWLAALLPETSPQVALVAVGGLGRRECAPHGDVDLMLLHRGGPEIRELADALWYPIWDARVGLDHSVRTVPEALAVARQDVKVALGLLDLRYLAGDRELALALRGQAAQQWRRTAAQVLPALREVTTGRWQTHGELAFLLEGDVKEARGGLRDVSILRGVGMAGVADAARPAVRAAHTRLLDVRDALHVTAGRRVDRLLAQDREAVAHLLDLADGDALLRRVAQDARAVAYAVDDAWRAMDRWNRPSRSPSRRPIGRDVVEQDGEAVLARTAVGPRPEPGLALRVAAAAANARLPIARATLEWLAAFCPPPPTPWPATAREALLTLLGSGAGLVPTWEACDRYGLVVGWLPEWSRLRGLPQHNPVHLYTVDRHLVQAAAEATAFAREVARPDLLVLAAFLHDIGKGLPSPRPGTPPDHSVLGAPVAARITAELGLPPGDAAMVEKLVRLHLLLPDVATRRDLADPVTIRRVAEAVGDVTTLDLLYGLTRADAAATGPGAWSRWKGRLVASLVDRVRSTLDTGEVPPAPSPDRGLVAGPLPAVHIDGERVAVAATDRRGLLAAVAGCLDLHRLDVVTADVSSVEGRTLVQCAVQARFGALPDAEALQADLRRAALGQLPERLNRRKPVRADGAAARVVWHRDAATDAAVLELRAADASGLLYRIARALEGAGAEVRAARISTLGGDVVDAFYLLGQWSDPAARSEVERAVLAAAE